MRRSLSFRFVGKAQAALTSAIEVYNKPTFAYREETFALLAINAWELLLKAKILADTGNKASSIRSYQPRMTKGGKMSTKLYVVRNRAGNAQNITLGECVAKLDGNPLSRIDPAVKANLWALAEIRNNAAHYIRASSILARQTLELGTASVKNFVVLAKNWFGRDLSADLSLILPLAFISGPEQVESVVVTADERRLLAYLQQLAATEETPGSDFVVAVRVEVKLERSPLTSAAKAQLSSDTDAVKITLSEEDFRRKYPWSYKELCDRLNSRYADFKQNAQYHGIRKPLVSDSRYAGTRYLDADNPRSAHQVFYNSNILKQFDPHYTTKSTSKAVITRQP